MPAMKVLGRTTIVIMVAALSWGCGAKGSEGQGGAEEPVAKSDPAPEPLAEPEPVEEPAEVAEPEPPPSETEIEEPPPPEVEPPPPVKLTRALKKRYVGNHSLGVNRVTDGERVGLATVVLDDEGRLFLKGSVDHGPYNLSIQGYVVPNGLKEFVLHGSFEGSPNLEFRREPPRHRKTEGQFTFRSKGARKYWRMYLVDGKDCVCDDGCGNDFCYIDVGFKGPK
jgi:hypothetical protein